jgi:hypothetical protein
MFETWRWGEPAPDRGRGGEPAKLATHRTGRPRAQLLRAVVHADLASAPALAVAHEHRSAPRVEVMLAEQERLLDAQPGTPTNDDDRPQPWRSGGARRITATISSTVGGSAG